MKNKFNKFLLLLLIVLSSCSMLKTSKKKHKEFSSKEISNFLNKGWSFSIIKIKNSNKLILIKETNGKVEYKDYFIVLEN